MLLLEKYIKKAVRKALKEQEDQLKQQEKSIYLIFKYPGLKKVMIDLMSPSFTRYISNVSIVAPKPTTFNIALTNGMDFYITHLGPGKFIAKVRGKKYNLVNLNETQRACQAIANMMELNYTPVEEKQTPDVDSTIKDDEIKKDLEKAGILSQPDNPAGTPTPEEPSTDEPSPEEETQ